MIKKIWLSFPLSKIIYQIEKLSSVARESEEELELSSSMSLLAISECILSVIHVTK